MTLTEQVAVPTKGRELVVFIKAELDDGDAAAKDAASPYYERAGLGLINAAAAYNGKYAREEFWAWAKENFDRNQKSLRAYMEIAFANNDLSNVGRLDGDDLDDLLRRFHKPRVSAGERRSREASKQATAFARDTAYKAPANKTSAAKERELRRKLCSLLIDTGYKGLAVKLHPDKKTGDQEAMARLNAVRDLLRKAVKDA